MFVFYYLKENVMRVFFSLAILFTLGCYAPVTLAADASVTIFSPKDGDKLSSTKKIKVKYKATLGEKGNHLQSK